jgi:small subunit ribosomal protein S20
MRRGRRDTLLIERILRDGAPLRLRIAVLLAMLRNRQASALLVLYAQVVGRNGSLANTKSAAKRARVSERQRQRNRVFRSAARTYVRRAERLIADGDAESAALAVGNAISTLDRAAAKGIIHKNNAARHKSRLMAKFNGLVRPAAEA